MTNEWYLQIEAFDFAQYENIDLDRLTTYSVKYLIDNNIEPLFENIVVALYKMFPKRFALVGFEEFPDSNRINRQLLHCRPKYRNYLVGGMRRGWLLTDKGLIAAEETEEIIKNPSLRLKKKKRRAVKERTKSVHFINEILSSEAFGKYRLGELEQISDLELCDVLHANLDTPTSIIIKSIRKLDQYAHTVGDKNVIQFLEFAKQRLVNGK